MKKYVSTRGVGGIRDSAGVGYIAIPKDKVISQFIQHCFRTGTVSITLENGGIINDVIITKSALREIEFPESSATLGSQVVWINQPRKNMPIIIGGISKSNEFVNFNDNKSTLSRSTIKGIAEVSVDAKNRVIVINSTSFDEKGGDIHIIASNKNRKSKLNVKIIGDINIQSDNFTITNTKKTSIIIKDTSIDNKVTEIIYEKGIGLSYKDEFENEIVLNGKNIQFKPASLFNIGEGNEPMLLGSTTQTELNKDNALWQAFLKMLETPIPEPGNGANSAFQAALSTALKSLNPGDYSKILSQISNTD